MKLQKTNFNSAVLKVVLTGPESTGKTTLTEKLAAHYQTVCVPEYARAYIEGLNRPYEVHDIVAIAKGQLAAEDFFLPKANKILICDTALLVPKIWSEVAYGYCPEWIEHQLMERQYDLYLLMCPDIEWQPDPQREHPHLRAELFEMYQSALQKLDTPYVIIEGNYQSRLEAAMQVINKMMNIVSST
ncbi:MAG: ATP-binding protein [Chitinophagales bacterium]